jgi:hypothetical protein
MHYERFGMLVLVMVISVGIGSNALDNAIRWTFTMLCRLVGKGTHAQLMVSCPEYQEIARSQLSQKELALDTLNTEKEGE